VWTNTFVEFQFFAFGTLLSLALRGTTPQLSPALRAGLLLACLGLWLAASEWAGVNEVHPVAAFKLLLGYWFVGFGCIALFLSVYGMPARWIPAPLVYLGKISYGLYVFHKLALDFATWILNRVPVHALKTSHTLFASGHIVLGFAMTTGAAMLSYRYFETPFLKLKDKFAVIHTRAV
jgi:peptidoglycan/LPS O-acetylase OafA/YrhL